MNRICQSIDQQVQVFLGRKLKESGYDYVCLNATYLKGKLGKAQQVCSSDVVFAIGMNELGRRVLLGNSCGEGFAYKVGDSESEPFWTELIDNCPELISQTNNRCLSHCYGRHRAWIPIAERLCRIIK